MRMPFSVRMRQRGVSLTRDSLRENCFIEGDPQGEVSVIQRHGVSLYVAAQTGASRGVWYWNGTVLHVWGTTLWRGNTPTSVGTIDGSGRVFFEDWGGGTSYLIIWSGTKGYRLQTNWTLTEITDGDFTGFSGKVGSPVYLNGRVFWGSSTGKILHSDTDDPMSYDPNNTLSAEAYPDNLLYLTRHLNYVMAVGEKSLEFFYDAQNPSGSVLARVSGQLSAIGSISSNTVAKDSDYVFFVGATAGGRTAFVVERGRPRAISDPVVDRILTSANFASAHAYVVRNAGHLVYGLYLPSENLTLWHDVGMQDWFVVKDPDGNAWPYRGAAYSSANTYMVSDAGVFTLGGNQDNGADFTMLVRTTPMSFGVMARKLMKHLELEADNYSGTVTMRYSDDDYQTWSTPRTLAAARPQAWNLGIFRKRALEISHTGNEVFRMHALDIDVGQIGK